MCTRFVLLAFLLNLRGGWRRAAEAVLSEANVEPYLPNAWTEEETSVLSHLVGMYGATHWAIISAGVDTKSETQVRKIPGKFWCFCENAVYVQYSTWRVFCRLGAP